MLYFCVLVSYTAYFIYTVCHAQDVPCYVFCDPYFGDFSGAVCFARSFICVRLLMMGSCSPGWSLYLSLASQYHLYYFALTTFYLLELLSLGSYMSVGPVLYSSVIVNFDGAAGATPGTSCSDHLQIID
jgi:hypothetical protein